jgi:dTDP-4-dehydrorhamnose reductase
MNPPLAWVTGAGGFIGHHLLQLAPQCAPRWHPRPLTRSELDLTWAADVEVLFQRERPGLILHCAAMSRSPACQDRPDLARQINVEVAAHLAHLAAGIPFVFMSSDLVFDGGRGRYTEVDAPHPLSVYGATKFEAERRVLENPRHLVVRTSLNLGQSPSGDRGVNEDMCRAWKAGRVLRLFTDEYRCPIPVEATARAIWELIAQGASGLFHVAGADRLSRWEIGRIVASRHPELEARMEPASIRDFAGAPRPADTSLNCSKVQARLSFRLPGLRQWIPG